MKIEKSIATGLITMLVSFSITGCYENNKDSKNAIPAMTKEDMENQAWQMEELYWEYVKKNDTISYKKLWHDDFIGYPSFGEGVSNKSKIAIWIPELHKDSSLTFNYKLYKRGVNAIGDVVMVFYDDDELWTDRENNIVKKETYKFTHTWKKYKDNWVILGGMAAKKNQDNLKNMAVRESLENGDLD